MFEDEADDDEPAGRAPLPPEDRLWRHPSEVGASGPGAAGPAAVEPPPRSVLMLAAVAVVAGFAGAGIAVALLAVTGSFSATVVERTAAVPAASIGAATTATATASPKTVKAMATATAPAVAHIEVTAGSTSRVGSGVVLRADGTIVTSEALVRDATGVTVTLVDGRSFPGRLAGTDEATGLAVVRVQATGLTALSPSQGEPQPGDQAVTVAGSDGPGASPAVTAGVVSALDRQVTTATGTLWGLIQTDRPVPADADGGALVSDDGRVAGIALSVGDGPAAGMGYAVPLPLAGSVADELVAHGKATWAWLGIEGGDLTQQEARTHHLTDGVLISAVTTGGPAAAAGLRAGDVVVSVAGSKVVSMATLVAALRSHQPGDTVSISLQRGAQSLHLTARLTEKR